MVTIRSSEYAEIPRLAEAASLCGRGYSVKSAESLYQEEGPSIAKANPFGPKTPQILSFR